jgi:hypothetical protein
MKRYILLLVTILSTSSFAQDAKTADALLFSSIVGTWQHVSSTYPWGDVVTYQREFQFFSDGLGICKKITDSDTIVISFHWEVKDSIVSLFEIQKNGRPIYADSQVISLVNTSKLYLKDAYCDENIGRVCCYRRTGNEIVKY